MLWSNCWIVVILDSEVRIENGRSELLGCVCLCMESGFGVVAYRRNRDQAPVLPGKGEQMHIPGWDGGCVGWSLVAHSPMGGK